HPSRLSSENRLYQRYCSRSGVFCSDDSNRYRFGNLYSLFFKLLIRQILNCHSQFLKLITIFASNKISMSKTQKKQSAKPEKPKEKKPFFNKRVKLFFGVFLVLLSMTRIAIGLVIYIPYFLNC